MSVYSVFKVCIICSVLQTCYPLSQLFGNLENFKLEDLQRALDFFNDTLKTTKIPDYNGKSGKLSYGLSSIKITTFDQPDVKLDMDPTFTELSLKARVGHVGLKGNWKFKYRSWWPLRFSDNGRFKVKVNEIKFALAASLKAFKAAPKLKISKCQCNIGSVSLKLSGGGSWLYSLWNSKIERKITKELNDKVCDANCRKIKTKEIAF